MAFYEYVGKDPAGVPRVFGCSHESATTAAEECKTAILEYLRRRPDTGPADKWTVLPRSFMA